MTEEEAKTRWCPFARSRAVSRRLDAVDTAVAAFELDGVWGTTCIGSACMAWRWTKAETVKFIGEGDNRRAVKVPEEGHCGLAGAVDSLQ